MNSLKHTFPQKTFHTGEVLDIQDPNESGRIRVKVHGVHSSDTAIEALPWATVATSISSASKNGVTNSGTGLLVGSWVIVIFLDADFQVPVVLGSICSRNLNESLSDIPDEAKSTNLISDRRIKKEQIFKDVGEIEFGLSRSKWKLPNIEETEKPIDPKNHVTKSESGHVIERDDSPGYERLLEMHRSGTYDEKLANGDQVNVVKKDSYTAIYGNDFITVAGDVNITVFGNARTIIGGHEEIEVLGNSTKIVHGNCDLIVKGALGIGARGKTVLATENAMDLHATGNVDVKGALVKLNS